jgi:hypothetical protein
VSFLKVVLKKCTFRDFGKNHVKSGKFLASRDLKRVSFSAPVTARKGLKRVVKWVPSLVIPRGLDPALTSRDWRPIDTRT